MRIRFQLNLEAHKNSVAGGFFVNSGKFSRTAILQMTYGGLLLQIQENIFFVNFEKPLSIDYNISYLTTEIFKYFDETIFLLSKKTSFSF